MNDAAQPTASEDTKSLAKENVDPTEEAAEIPTASLLMRVQKKVLSKMSTRAVAKHFIIKNVLKIAVKLRLLAAEEKFTKGQHLALAKLHQKLRNAALTLLSFARVSYSYEPTFLLTQLGEVQSLLTEIVGETLSEKSQKRVAFIFKHVAKAEIFDSLFRPGQNGTPSKLLDELASDLESAMELKEL
ncbi:hypothetical protein AAVH_17002 [Aphelenchoides avenae]|nr:hypothetical protein AAVH_17002 [Aphelenchus avenae]